MSEDNFDRVRRVAYDYASRETKFAHCSILSVKEAIDYKHELGLCCVVKLALSFSAEQIEGFIAGDSSNDPNDLRQFLTGDWILQLIIAGDVVVEKEWENMDLD